MPEARSGSIIEGGTRARNRSQRIMVDRRLDSDVQAGRNAGCKTVRIENGEGKGKCEPDLFASTLPDAVWQILRLEGPDIPRTGHGKPFVIGGKTFPLSFQDA